jgi:hypothetical protein
LKKHKRSGDVWKFGDKLAEAVKCGRPRGGQHYESFVRGCVGPSGLRTDWFNFVIGLITIFSREYKLFFEWLLIESKTIKLGNKILPSHGLTGKSKDDAISFTLAVLMVIYVKQCSRHYMSGLKRKDRKQRRRTKEIIKPSSVTEQFSTEAMTKSLAAGSTPEGSNTVGLPKIPGTVDENAQSEPLSNG